MRQITDRARTDDAKLTGVELSELLNLMDRAASNLAKLEEVWTRAQPFVQYRSPGRSDPEYDGLRRIWADLLTGLRPIDGFIVTTELPDLDDRRIGVAEEPSRQLAEYGFRLGRARRRAARERIQHLVAVIDNGLPTLLADIPRDSRDELNNETTKQISAAVNEIEQLIGDISRRGRWGDLHRHLHFTQGHDWHDIAEFDWPTVKPDIEGAYFTDVDPLPLPDIDLGQAAASNPTGAVAVGLNWSALDGAGFERVLFELFTALDGYQNVQWLMHTNAPDRGRDLSCEQVIADSTDRVRTERVIIQAKHWQSSSISTPEVSAAAASVSLWEPPRVHTLIVATSGRFTADAVAWAERHNDSATGLYVDLWPESRIEVLLGRHPAIVASYGLRTP